MKSKFPRSYESVNSKLLGDAWPARNRHAAQLHLAGALRWDGFSEEDAYEILCGVCREAGNEEASKRAATVRGTWERDDEFTGWPTLIKEGLLPAHTIEAAKRLLRDSDRAEGLIARMVRVSQGLSPTNDNQPDETKNARASVLGLRKIDWSKPPPPIEWLVQDVIVRGSVVGLVAHGDSCKTWIAHSIALAVASGKPWLGKFATQKGRALIVDYESGHHETWRRLDILDRSPWLRALREVSDDLPYAYPDAHLSDEALWEEIVELAPDLVVIDSLSAGGGDVDENTTAAAVPLKFAGKVAEVTGATVLVLHHATKGNKDRREMVRGSSAIFAAFDTVYTVNYEHDTAIELRVSKPGPMRAPVPVRMSLASDNSGLHLDEVRPDRPEVSKADTQTVEGLRAAILLMVKQYPGSVPAEIARRLKRQQKPVREEVKIMIDRGEIANVDRKLYPNEEHDQEQRVRDALNGPKKFHTPAPLAAKAGVRRELVEDLIKRGVLGRAAGDSPIFLVG